MPGMSDAEMTSKMEQQIADAVLGKIGEGKSKDASIADILWCLQNGPQTIAALQQLVTEEGLHWQKV